MSVSIAVMLVVLMPADALAAGCTESWAKAESGSWGTAANWSPEKVPTASDEVCITKPGEYTVTVTGSVSVESLTLGASSGATKQTLLVDGLLSSGALNLSTSATIAKTGVLNLESTSSNDAVVAGSATISNGGELLSSASSTNYLEANLTTAASGVVDLKSGELRQDDNTTTINEGAFDVEGGAIFAATAGTDKFVNRGSLANGGSVSLANDASWTQEAGTSSETGNPVSIFNSGQLTDVSGVGSFDLVDTAVLSGMIPAGQTVTADAIPSHNAEVKVSGTVTNEGTLALDSPAGGGEPALEKVSVSSRLGNRGVLSTQSQSGQVDFLEVPLANEAAATVDVESGELRQDENTTTTNDGIFEVKSGAIFAATAGADEFVNKGSLANAGSVSLTNDASWTQEAGTSSETGSPVSIFNSGQLTDVSGVGGFDLVDTAVLSGTVPAGQSVTADAIPSHNALVKVSGTVTNEGTLALVSPSKGGEPGFLGTSSRIDNDGVLTTQSETSNPSFLEANLTNAAAGTVDVEAGELRQDENTTTINEGAFEVAAGAIFAETSGTDVFTNEAGGTLRPDIASATSYGIVKASSGATFTPGGTISPNLVGGYAPPVGAEFDVIAGESPIGGEFATVANNFLGDYSKASSSPSTIAVKRDRDSTVTALLAQPESLTRGQSVTFTATITTGQGPIGSPTGTVTFFDGASELGSGEVSTAAGVTSAAFTTSALAVGHDKIVAGYNGDPNYGTSSSAPAEVTVAEVPPTLTTIEPPGPSGGGGGGRPEARIATGKASTTPVVPPPLLVKTGNVAPVSGTVLVQLPGTSKFVPLSTLRQIPFGSVIEATHGTVSVTTAEPGGKTQTGEFFEGEFILRQGPNGIVIAELTGGDFSVCPTKRERSHIARAGAAPARAGTTLARAAASGSHVVRKLWANAHGKFSTKGNYAAGAVQGTEWLTEDLCDGTLIRVTRDKVAVTNLVNHKHVEVTTGHKYLAKAP
jgi:hypothetical protein